MTAEEYIKAYTRGCSNELCAVEDRCGKKVVSYHEWLTPENALAAVELAREKMQLTWQDIRDIVKAADLIVDADEDGKLITIREEGYYQMVLDKWKEMHYGKK